MLVTDRKIAGGEGALIRVVEAVVCNGVNVIQLREKNMPTDELLPLARQLREVTRGRALLLVNGPLEVALASQADGVHLSEAAAMPERATGRPFIMGRSVHSVEAAERARADCMDYLIAGPVFETPSHPGVAVSGLGLIEAISSAVAIPVIAIGGITSERVEEVLRAGASGIACVGAILAAQSTPDATRRLRESLDAMWAEKAVP